MARPLVLLWLDEAEVYARAVDRAGARRACVNLYSYVWNNPLRYVDALGLTGHPSG